MHWKEWHTVNVSDSVSSVYFCLAVFIKIPRWLCNTAADSTNNKVRMHFVNVNNPCNKNTPCAVFTLLPSSHYILYTRCSSFKERWPRTHYKIWRFFLYPSVLLQYTFIKMYTNIKIILDFTAFRAKSLQPYNM